MRPTGFFLLLLAAFMTCAPSRQVMQQVVGTSAGTTGITCGPPNYLCSSSSTANPSTASGPLFITSAPTATTCSGDCQNSYHYGDLNPSYDIISRLSDGTTFPSGASVGNVTCSGGDNDLMGSINETYFTLVQGGFARIFHSTIGPNGAYQVANSGGQAGISVTCPIAFSQTTDNVFYQIKSATQIWKYTITSDTTTTSSELFDITGATGGFQPCPGINWTTFGTPTSNSILEVSKNDGRISFAVGPGGQGSADIMLVWDSVAGCKTINLNSGNYWAFCNSSCSASTPAAGNLSSQATACYGSQGSISKGIHDAEMTGDGNTLLVTTNSGGGWTGGACNGMTFSVMYSIYEINTDVDYWGYNDVPGQANGIGNMGGHPTTGITHILTPFYNGPDNFLASAPGTTNFAFLPSWAAADVHASWPHPLGDDSYPWIFADDLGTTAQTTGCGTPAYCPTYPQNLIGAFFPNTSSPGITPKIFARTYSCGNGSTAACAGGVFDHYFGGYDAIGYVTAKGNYFIWASTNFGSSGNDNSGNPRQDAYAVHLQ